MGNFTQTLSREQKLLLKRIDEVFDLYSINNDEQDRLIKMVKSNDEENLVVAETIIKNFVRDELAKGLNPDQASVFNGLIDYTENPVEDAAVLKGYAGTGKTFLINRVIEYIQVVQLDATIAVTAPTNKAVKVIHNASKKNKKATNAFYYEDVRYSSNHLVYSTIHKLLGLKEVITLTGEQTFKPDDNSRSQLSEFKYLILDEVSMLDDEICKEILKYSNRLKIIFLGDPCQIPPVKGHDPIPFKTNTGYNFKTFQLTQLMRQKDDNPIIDFAYAFRTNLTVKQPHPVLKTTLNRKKQGLYYIDFDTEKHTVRPLLTRYYKSKQYEKNSDYIKIIGWTNKTVTYMNNLVREILFGKNPDRFILGEKLVVQKSIFELTKTEHSEFWTVMFNTSEELTVYDIGIGEVWYKENTIKRCFKTYKLYVEAPSEDSQYPRDECVHVIHEDDYPKYQALLDDLKKRAILMKMPQPWVTYYNVLKWSANVAYNYAITAHKSQGSTYKNVLIMEDDLDFNQKTVERNRIKYTAYTRPTDKLYVVRKNEPVTLPVKT